MDIGFVSAFIGGVLALLSPCAALLLPAFFASTVGARSHLLLHGAVFYIGMLLVLVPLGIGAGALGSLFTAYRTEIVAVAAVILIVLGVVQFLGFGFDPAKLVPGGDAARIGTAQAGGMARKTFLLGSTSGVAGMCAGPILGAVLTRSRPPAATSWAPPSCSRSTARAWSSRSSSWPLCGTGWADADVPCSVAARSLSSGCACTRSRCSPERSWSSWGSSSGRRTVWSPSPRSSPPTSSHDSSRPRC